MTGFAIKQVGTVENIESTTALVLSKDKKSIEGIRINKSDDIIYAKVFSGTHLLEAAEIGYSSDPQIINKVYDTKAYPKGNKDAKHIGKVAVRDISVLGLLAKDEYLSISYEEGKFYYDIKMLSALKEHLRDALLFTEEVLVRNEIERGETIVLYKDPIYTDRIASFENILRQFGKF